MKRREFIALLGGAAVAWPLTARSQQRPMPVLGLLSSLSAEAFTSQLAAFLTGLKEEGFIEGRNVAIEYRWADGHYDRLAALAADLAQRHVDVIAATGGSALATKTVTTTIPVVFNVAEDPVRDGLVASLNRPGGNMTGVSMLTTSLEAKRVELLHELLPTASLFGLLVNPNFSQVEAQRNIVQGAATKLGRQIRVFHAGSERGLSRAFASATDQGIQALLVASDPFFFVVREELVALAARYAVPTGYFLRDFVAAGGLMSYGTSLFDVYRQMGVYAGRILKGTKPAELPIVQPTKFELLINLKTARALGLAIPQTLQVAADEVIE